MTPNSLIAAASFTPHSIQSPNAWVGHLPFAAWVMQDFTPDIFVELGTHSGNSYFSFCQSVVESRLSSKCFAVDTWQGDEHSGQYTDDIFSKVNAHNQERYVSFSNLLRTTFDEATSQFADASVDLLHIDGLHTYEAVRHDFETWLPKLAPGALVLFHDTNVHKRNFGVWQLWEELKPRYPYNLEFMHSNGLGVLQISAGSNEKMRPWLQPDSPDRQAFIDYFSALGARQLERFELKELIQHATHHTEALAIRDHDIANLWQAVAERDTQIANRDHDVANLWQAVAERDTQIANLEGDVANLWQAVAERDRIIGQLSHDLHMLRSSIAYRFGNRLFQPLQMLRRLVAGRPHKDSK